MLDVLRVEAELPLTRLNFPARLDHSWGFSTSLVHARPFALQVAGPSTPAAAHLDYLGGSSYRIAPRSGATWLDGRPVTTKELARAVRRGSAHLARRPITVTGSGRDGIEISCGFAPEQLRQRLASAAFALTPCTRDQPGRDTSGPFRVVAVERRGATVEFEARQDQPVGIRQCGFRRLRLTSTSGPDEGQRLLRSGQLDLTRVLGGYRPGLRSDGLNCQVGIVMGLRLTNRALISEGRLAALAGILDIGALAAATDRTYAPLTLRPGTSGASQQGRGPQRPPGGLPFVLSYADFYPNGQVARLLATQLQDFWGIRVVAADLDYNRYLGGEPASPGLMLDLIDPSFESLNGNLRRDFLPLLRARSTLDASCRIDSSSCCVNSLAEVVWDQVTFAEEAP